MRYRLVATDMDGTLLNQDREVSESTRLAVQRLQRQGIHLVLVTARPPGMITEIYRDLGLSGPIIACTGALIYDPTADRVLAQHPIPRAIVLQVLAAIRSADPTMPVGADLVTEWHVDRLRKAGLDRHLYITSAGGIVDMVAAGVDKGAALRALVAMLGVPKEQTLAIGDDENDIPFLSAAGLGIAMGNAVDEVKAVAGAVTGANSEDGWATAMERFVFAG